MCYLAVQFGLVDYVDAKLRTPQTEGVRKEDYTQELKEWDRNNGSVQELCTTLLRSALQFPDPLVIMCNIRLQYK
jgi:hypothetical protein